MLSAQSTEVSHYSCPGLSPKFMLLTINNASLTSSIWPLGNNSQFLKSGTENAFNPSSHNLDPITDLWIYEASPWLGCNLATSEVGSLRSASEETPQMALKFNHLHYL